MRAQLKDLLLAETPGLGPQPPRPASRSAAGKEKKQAKKEGPPANVPRQRAVSSCGQDFRPFLRCLVKGGFLQTARLETGATYRTLTDNRECRLHPASALFARPPPLVLFSGMLCTSRLFLLHCSAVDPAWLLELCPGAFRAG